MNPKKLVRVIVALVIINVTAWLLKDAVPDESLWLYWAVIGAANLGGVFALLTKDS